MTPNMLVYSLALFGVLFVLGIVLCLRLYHWDHKKFFNSQLWIKTYYWIPIFLLFIALLYIQLPAAIVVFAYIALQGTRELLRVHPRTWLAYAYMAAVLVASAHLILFFTVLDTSVAIPTLLIIGFSSVLSDVFAYFLGNFYGRHKLPRWINPNKSWEGVLGQLLGAIVGFILVLPVITSAPSIALALVIGIASAMGDIVNSIVKRNVHIKDWGNSIPGHGGVLDRFASLSFAIAAAYWYTSVF